MKEVFEYDIALYKFTMSLDEPRHKDRIPYFETVRKLHGAFVA